MDDNNILRMPVELVMMDGNRRSGDMLLSIGGEVERTLNSEARFFSFDDGTGKRFIAKDSVAEVIPQARQRRAA